MFKTRMAFEQLSFPRLLAAFNDKKARDAAVIILKDHYKEVFGPKVPEPEKLVDKVMASLAAAWMGFDTKNTPEENSNLLWEMLRLIRVHLYKVDNPDFWFNEAYTEYKSHTKPSANLNLLKNSIWGERLLDYGSGLGYFARLLSDLGGDAVQVFASDVNTYDRQLSSPDDAVHYHAMEHPTGVPISDRPIDTTFCITVLHHIHETQVREVLKKLAQISYRVVVVEDVIDLPSDANTLLRDPRLRTLAALSPENLFNAMVFIDFFGNILAQGMTEMPMPFSFRTVPEWRQLFQDCGFENVETKIVGFAPRGETVHGFTQAVFVLNSKVTDYDLKEPDPRRKYRID